MDLKDIIVDWSSRCGHKHDHCPNGYEPFEQPPTPPTPPSYNYRLYPYSCTSHNHYAHDCVGHRPPIKPNQFVLNGPLIGNGFILNETNPYLLDTTGISYGQMLCMSENIYTNVVQRKDPSCINLTMNLDMTDTLLTNTVRSEMIEKNIEKRYSTLDGILPMITPGYKVCIYYTILNNMNGVEYKNVVTSFCPTSKFHFTDVNDVFVSSIHNYVVTNIPPMTYEDIYTINIEKAEIWCGVINTAEHIEDDVNPLYTFIDNNMKIKVNVDEVRKCQISDEILIGTCDINKQFDFRSKITTRLRVNFVAYISNPIAVGDTTGIWNSLFTPTDEMVQRLNHEVETVQEELAEMKEIMQQQNLMFEKINEKIATNTNLIKALQESQDEISTRINDLSDKVSELENSEPVCDIDLTPIQESVNTIQSDVEKLQSDLDDIKKDLYG